MPIVHQMLGFAQDTATCRKILFAQYDLFVLILGDCNTERESIRYFQMSSNVGMNAWSTEEEDARKKCGHCDNCTRDPDSIEEKNVTLESWQILKVAQAIANNKGRATLAQLVTIACGGKAQYSIVGAGRRSSIAATLDVNQVAGGKVSLSKDVSLQPRRQTKAC